jgi:hypothetical protein
MAKEWQRQFNMAKLMLNASDDELTWRDGDYEAFMFKRGDVQILFYPHKTSANNYHIRVRDSGSKNKKLAQRIMDRLSESTGTCTFSQKNRGMINETKWHGVVSFFELGNDAWRK